MIDGTCSLHPSHFSTRSHMTLLIMWQLHKLRHASLFWRRMTSTRAMQLVVFLFCLVVSCNFYRIPPHEEVARVARFVANQCNWASMATISTHEPVKGQPFSNAFSMSDGPVGFGTGVPYMYLTHMEISVQDLEVGTFHSTSLSLK